MLDLHKVRAVSLDLDDTLWPIWPTIARAEQVLAQWLAAHAPRTAALYGSAQALREIREQVVGLYPEHAHDMGALRHAAIRLALRNAGDDEALADEGFAVFFAERQRVDLFEDALPALEFLATRLPVVAVSNGNADVERVGIGRYFKASLSARGMGIGKPDARIFHAAAQAAGVAPDEVLHVGDDALLDVVGALGAGLQAAWLNRGEHPWTQEVQPHVRLANLRELCALF